MTLAEALEPLYRSYLRRLDEMAARVPRDALLAETVTRGDDGRLLAGEDGLPLRFDVANGASGQTFEVHGTKPDAPLVPELQAGRVQVRLSPGNWEELPVVCVFDGEPLAEDAEELADLIRAFAVFAAHAGFAHTRKARGTAGAASWSGRLHALRIELREQELWSVFDFGTCPPAALDALCAALSGYSEERVPIAHVRIGGRPPPREPDLG